MTTAAKILNEMTAEQRRCADLLDAQGFQKAADRVRSAELKVNGRLTSTAGRCTHRWNRPLVEISLPIFKRPENLHGLTDTITHELAHAACGRGEGHGLIWKAMHRRFGGSASTYHNLNTQGLGTKSEIGHCPCCGIEISLTKRMAKRIAEGERRYHPACGRVAGRIKLGPAPTTEPTPLPTPLPVEPENAFQIAAQAPTPTAVPKLTAPQAAALSTVTAAGITTKDAAARTSLTRRQMLGALRGLEKKGLVTRDKTGFDHLWKMA